VSDAAALYRDLVTGRARAARHRGLLRTDGARLEHAENVVCGDALTLEIAGEPLRVRYEGEACLVCLASAELLAEHATGRTIAEALSLATRFLGALETGHEADLPHDLAALLAVRALPVRVACAKLPWDALVRALPGGAT